MNFPDDTQRIVIVGATGSGKTQAGIWHLSMRSFLQKPWIVYDFKGDNLIQSIDGAMDLDASAPIPERPGLYIVKAHPGEIDLVDQQMQQIWEAENIGVYIDEGMMLGTKNRGFRMLLTQGRSKHIPMIVLSQRPVWMDRFVFSESEFFQIFRLQHRKDRAAVSEFVPFDLTARLPKYHSYYYDVNTDEAVVMEPVPDRDALLDTFRTKLRRIENKVRSM